MNGSTVEEIINQELVTEYTKRMGHQWDPTRIARVTAAFSQYAGEGITASWALTEAYMDELELYGDESSYDGIVGILAPPSAPPKL